MTRVHVEAEEEDYDMSNVRGENAKNLYTFSIEGCDRNVQTHVGPPANVMSNPMTFTRTNYGWPTTHSPRGDGFQYEKMEVYTFRCDTEALLHRVVDEIRSVLADDGLCPPVRGGLPPIDPRNQLRFAHVPVFLTRRLKPLVGTAFYTLTRGDMIAQGPRKEVGTALAGGYLCLSDTMALVVRPDASVPRWVRLEDVAEVEVNTTAAWPFVALLTIGTSPDVVFVPAPPAFGPEEVKAFKGEAAVKELRTVLVGLSRFLVQAGRRTAPITFTDVNRYDGVRAYVEARGKTRPWKWMPLDGFHEPLRSPRPLADLAKELHMETGSAGPAQSQPAVVTGIQSLPPPHTSPPSAQRAGHPPATTSMTAVTSAPMELTATATTTTSRATVNEVARLRGDPRQTSTCVQVDGTTPSPPRPVVDLDALLGIGGSSSPFTTGRPVAGASVGGEMPSQAQPAHPFASSQSNAAVPAPSTSSVAHDLADSFDEALEELMEKETGPVNVVGEKKAW